MKRSSTIKPAAAMSRQAKSGAPGPRAAANFKVVVGAGIAVALLLGGLILAAMPPPAANVPAAVPASPRPAGTLAALATQFNFGSISMARGKVAHRYMIRNIGTEPLRIGKMYTSCMCTTAALIKDGRKSAPYGMRGHGPMPPLDAQMNPGESAAVEVVFDPAAHGPAGVGPVTRVVIIENSAGRPLELAFAATVTP